ncbi:MAG: hypothetical protein WCG36_03450 [bacterium]
MDQSQFRSGRLEFALCIAVPLVALAVTLIPGHGYCRHLSRNLAQREAWLKTLPVLEGQLATAQQALKPFAVVGVAGDKASELSLCANQAAETSGFTVRSVNVEKQAGTGSEPWSDYSVMIAGDGSLKSLIRTIDSLEHQSRLRVAHVGLKAKWLVPDTAYGVDMTMLSRNVPVAGKPQIHAYALPVSITQVEGMGVRLAQSSEAIKVREQRKSDPLSLKALDSRKTWAGSLAPVEEPLSEVSFKLSGIIRDSKRPLAMTDRGVFGVGDEIDDFTIIAIADDKVTVKSRQGRREVLKLYSEKIGK